MTKNSKNLYLRFESLILLVLLALVFMFTGCCFGSGSSTPTTTTIDNTSIKYGLTEAQKKQAYYELVALQDSISIDDPPNRSEKMVILYHS